MCIQNGKPFVWTPLLDKCFESIKTLTCKALILKPIDASKPEPIWVICDSSKSGVRALYGQGPDWQSCHPAGFLSKKFSSAQQSYRTHEHETIAILEALIKWEDKLLGQQFVIVTDHKSLEHFKTQPHLSSRQTRWWEYTSRFNFTIQHVDGTTNWVSDCLSCYYEANQPDETHLAHEFVTADVKLNPEAKLLPIRQYVEIHSAAARWSHHLAESVKQRVLDSAELNQGTAEVPSKLSNNAPRIQVRCRWPVSMYACRARIWPCANYAQVLQVAPVLPG